MWWWRLADIASRPGEHKNELQRLLTGRPSDLAAEAEHTEAPPAPPEVEYVSNRDFRIIHFGGLALVWAEVPEEFDPHLVARVARERYGVAISLVRAPDSETFYLGSDDSNGRRSFDVGSMVEHLGLKFRWVEVLPDLDHVARFRARGALEQPERVDELISEIGMGRSILEG